MTVHARIRGGSDAWSAAPELWSAQRSAAADRHTLDTLGIASESLMERAALAVSNSAEQLGNVESGVCVLCGPGNNGADGFAIARQLALRGWSARAIRVCPPRGMAQRQASWASKVGVQISDELDAITALPGQTLVVDAMLGTGSVGAPRARVAQAIALLRARPELRVIAVDLPSGVDASTGEVGGLAVVADLTVTFAGLEVGLVVSPGREHSGKIVVADIGLVEPPESGSGSSPHVIDGPAAFELLPRLSVNAHKGLRGHVRVVGGSDTTPGAIVLSARSALVVGAGLASVATESRPCRRDLLAACPELMIADRDDLFAHEAPGAWVVGPGLLEPSDAWRDQLRRAYAEELRPMVWDASALNLVDAEVPISGPRIMTPHPGEAAAMIRRWAASEPSMAAAASTTAAQVQAQRLHHARIIQQRTGAVIVLKGRGSIVAGPDERLAVCLAGGPELATAGSGDCLAGLIAGLCARGLDAFPAACLAVQLHAVAGEQLSRRTAHPTATELQADVGRLLAECREDGLRLRATDWPEFVRA